MNIKRGVIPHKFKKLLVSKKFYLIKTNVNPKKKFPSEWKMHRIMMFDTLLRLPVLETIHFFQEYFNI